MEWKAIGSIWIFWITLIVMFFSLGIIRLGLLSWQVGDLIFISYSKSHVFAHLSFNIAPSNLQNVLTFPLPPFFCVFFAGGEALQLRGILIHQLPGSGQKALWPSTRRPKNVRSWNTKWRFIRKSTCTIIDYTCIHKKCVWCVLVFFF